MIIQADNGKDLEEIDQTVRKALQFVLVERADQVLSAALLPQMSAREKDSDAMDAAMIPTPSDIGSGRLRQ